MYVLYLRLVVERKVYMVYLRIWVYAKKQTDVSWWCNMKNVKWVIVLMIIVWLVLSAIEASTMTIISEHIVGWAFLTGSLYMIVYQILQD